MIPHLRAARFAGLLAAIAAAPSIAAAAAWLPISPDDLKMTSEALAPGASAICLYRQIDRDDADYNETHYVRIKILTSDGLKYANVEIPFNKRYETIRGIEARTIRPDGTIVQFSGQVFERPVLEAKGVKIFEKTLTLPAAEVGSIIEYRYVHLLRFGWVYDSHWILSAPLFTRDSKFSLEPNPTLSLRWSWPRGLPEGAGAPTTDHHRVMLEVHNMPAFVTEDHMPPADELKYRVDFIYSSQRTPEKDPGRFWQKFARVVYYSVERFTNERRAMANALAEIALPADSPESKLRKIYARVGQIRNLEFEPAAEREADKQSAAAIDDVADVWKRGYGMGGQINQLFLALARAAGMQAELALVSTRDKYFFNPNLMNAGQLDSNLVIVTLGGRKYYLEPGIPFTPFGLLPWGETGVRALVLGPERSEWISTPLPAPTDSQVKRKASLRLDAGSLQGKLTVAYTGLEASWRRLQMRGEDDAARRQFLEHQLQGAIPTGSTLKLTNSPDWSGVDSPLVAEFELDVPGWATLAGRHELVPVGLFGGAEKHVFEHAERTQPIYFEYPYLHHDDVTVEVPAGWSVQSVPKPRDDDLKGVVYVSRTDASGQTIHMTRDLTLDLTIVDTKFYDALRQFFETVRSGDEDDVVLSSGTVSQAR